MTRISAATCAAALMFGLTVNAQDSKVTTTTKSKGGDAQTVTYTGCVGAGTETKTYVLNNVVPVTRTTETIGTAGTSTVTETRYMLVPGDTVTIQEHVGHKVQVTGSLIPGGDSKTQTKTKIDRDDGPDSTIKEKTKSDDAAPQFRVTAIRDLAERCQ
jgi:hypothetical protein